MIYNCDFMLDRIKKAVATHTPIPRCEKGLVPAAVLVPLFIDSGRLNLLLSRRTDQVLKHKGQISFPGGVRDPSDQDMVTTALREAHEEVGIDPQDVRILGLLNDVTTTTDYLVTPVVGTIPFPYDFKLNPAEVKEIILVPWEVFFRPRYHRRETVLHRGEMVEVDYYRYKEHTIWGLTARITRQLVELVEKTEPESPSQN